METTIDAELGNHFDFPPVPTDAIGKKYYEIIKNFVTNSTEKTFAFDSSVNTNDRKIIHALADQFGGLEHQSKGFHFQHLISQSGRGSERFVTLEKRLTKLKSGAFNPVTNQWETTHQLPNLPISSQLSIITQNVLFELNDTELQFTDIIYSSKRVPLLQDLIGRNFAEISLFSGQTDADLIALQEVMPNFHSPLLTQKWLQNKYYISDISQESVNPGVMLLSKYPFGRVFSYQYTRSRKVLLVAEVFINSRRLVVGVVHLKAGNFQQYGMM
jgi:hypothetical protein